MPRARAGSRSQRKMGEVAPVVPIGNSWITQQSSRNSYRSAYHPLVPCRSTVQKDLATGEGDIARLSLDSVRHNALNEVLL